MKDTNEWQFRDQKLPARLWYLARDEEVSLKDVLLLTIVDALVKPQGGPDEPGRGCYATNQYLGKALKAHPIHISKRIKLLNQKGCLIIIRFLDQRYLETEWSRTAEERAELTGPYGKALRRAYKKLCKQIEQNKKLEANPLSRKANTPLAARLIPPLSRKANQNIQGEYKKESEENRRDRNRSRHKLTGVKSSNGKLVKSELIPNGFKSVYDKREECARRLAKILHEGLLRRKEVQRKVNFAQWTKRCGELLDILIDTRELELIEASNYIEQVFLIHIENLKTTYMWPGDCSPPSWERFQKMENAISRLQNGKQHQSDNRYDNGYDNGYDPDDDPRVLVPDKNDSSILEEMKRSEALKLGRKDFKLKRH